MINYRRFRIYWFTRFELMQHAMLMRQLANRLSLHRFYFVIHCKKFRSALLVFFFSARVPFWKTIVTKFKYQTSTYLESPYRIFNHCVNLNVNYHRAQKHKSQKKQKKNILKIKQTWFLFIILQSYVYLLIVNLTINISA